MFDATLAENGIHTRTHEPASVPFGACAFFCRRYFSAPIHSGQEGQLYRIAISWVHLIEFYGCRRSSAARKYDRTSHNIPYIYEMLWHFYYVVSTNLYISIPISPFPTSIVDSLFSPMNCLCDFLLLFSLPDSLLFFFSFGISLGTRIARAARLQ